MASLLQRLLKKHPPPLPPLQILSSLNKLYPTFTNPNHSHPPLQPTDSIPNPPLLPPPNPSPQSLHIYPTFPHFVDLPTISISRCVGSDVEDGGDCDDRGGDRTVWADSVKKKRKRKMNKHKLKKLRKRLRRKT
uniref:Small ribosomal subunit protein mS38 n=1 Tax=Ananas comosus var. bracteatus TaxID=296719 RepID=A0A6V7Q821_ANACO|nr:unnamed protein product [Ananas comosus var. bracteatus]